MTTTYLPRSQVLALAAKFPAWTLVITATHAEVTSPTNVRYVAEPEPIGVAS